MTLKQRSIKTVWEAIPTMEGAGVALKRVFGNREADILDPFLLLDDFGSEDPEDYIKGFPWHPHRGIETITYMINGEVKHGDSLGNKGIIKSGEVQYMTAASGIIHEEMPKQNDKEKLWGFQLWANLPKTEKMSDPKYRDLRSNMIPVVEGENNVKVKIICGDFNGVQGPVSEVSINPYYLDVSIPAETEFTFKVPADHTMFNYVYEGSALFGKEQRDVGIENLVVYNPGDFMSVRTEAENVNILLVAGKPLNEPIAWYGPMVMNTQEEIWQAINDYNSGNFIKNKPKFS